MKSKITFIIYSLALVVSITSCTKYSNDIDGTANTATTGSASLSLNNRVAAGFVINASTLPGLPAGSLPASYNVFRKLLTYDTVTTANKPPAYKAGDVITIAGYLKGDDFAISKRRINVSLYKAPTAFITPANPPSVINVMQNAEDRYRSYQPGAVGSATAPDTTFSLATIAPATTAPFTVTKVISEQLSGVSYNTYLVQVSFTIPVATATKWLPGQVFSINLNAGVAAGDLGNVNWIYAFRLR
jgi:hypothetical protein